MSEHVMAVDAGTTSVRVVIVAADGRVVGHARNRYGLRFPAPGLVEQDPEELWGTTAATIAQALKSAGLAAAEICALGVTTQRATAVVWERASGKALCPAVSWQDHRGAQRAKELNDMGFITVAALTPAAKLESVLRALPGGLRMMGRGELAWGGVDSFLVWRLTGGVVHATDPSNACATGYYDYLAAWDWDAKLLEVQGLDRSIFPKVVDTAGEVGSTARNVLGAEIPIGSIVGDQQSAAYAQGCMVSGEGKVTFGTSGTFDVNTGAELKLTAGTYPLVLWQRGDTRTYCLEGMVITAGAVFDWLAGVGLLSSPAQAGRSAASVGDTHGVSFLPALQGLGTPYSRPERHGAFEGLTLGASAGHLVRAATEGVAYRVREMVDAVYRDSGLSRPESLRADGGAAENDVLMQIQADVLGRPVERMSPVEATGFGAALLAGEARGLWKPWSSPRMRRIDRVFEPRWSEDEREARFQAWQKVWHG